MIPRHSAFPGLTLVVSGALALIVAWFTETYLHIMPCELCLVERFPWKVLVVLGVFTAVYPKSFKVSGYIATIILLVSLGLSICHVGVEWGFWSSPLPGCQAPHISGKTVAERLASMPKLPGKPCDYPTYLIPGLPVSMSFMGGLYAIVVFLVYFRVRHRYS